MSENKENTASSAGNSEPSKEQSNNAEAYVPKDAYQNVTNDMHKYKALAKDLKAQLAKIEADKRADEDQKLKEQEKWQQYAKSLEEQIQQEKSRATQAQSQMIKGVKMRALKEELGGNVSDIYLEKLVDYSRIDVNDDGSVNSESILDVANEFRKQHGSLIPESGTVNPSGPAAPSNPGINSQKSVSDMSKDEKFALLTELRRKNN